jgi:formylmethanofuran dehydrogenase subunit E
MYRTDDPGADFLRWDADRADEESRLPHCDVCENPIYEKYFHINGEILCEKCMRQIYEFDTEDYLD